jgi:hypothetical protein
MKVRRGRIIEARGGKQGENDQSLKRGESGGGESAAAAAARARRTRRWTG